MSELENKIREAIPRLKELTKGCIVDNFHGEKEIIHRSREINNTVILDVFSNDNGFDTWMVKDGVFSVDGFKFEVSIVGHPIKINDILEYITEKNCYGGITISNRFYITNGYRHYFWDLSSVFLADQNDELKKFLNDL